MYLKKIKEHFSSYDDGKSLQIKLTEMEETFRNPNLLIQTIKESQQKQKDSLKEIQLKLDEINQVKDHFKGNRLI
jgi:Ca2+-binding EF-hand superfamily protein